MLHGLAAGETADRWGPRLADNLDEAPRCVEHLARDEPSALQGDSIEE